MNLPERWNPIPPLGGGKNLSAQGVIADLAHEMAAAAPRSLIHVGYHGAMGTQYKNSLQLVRAVACVNVLMGNYNQLGGLFEPPKVKLGKLNPDKFPRLRKSKVPW